MLQISYDVFFRNLTGFDASPFQLRVADALLAEKNVILRAPTGSGKTWAVVAPFLYSVVARSPIADRLLYALPLRSLATSLFDSTCRDVGKCEFTSHLSPRIRIQTGEMKQDSLFEALVTFSTIDQLLSSYILHPVGLPKRCGNLNAGAALGSLICFDEFHLLDPQKSMATAIEMLDTVAVSNPLSRFVLMTATLATESMNWLADKLRAELIEVPPEEVKKLPSQQQKVRKYRWIDEPLSAAAVTKIHGGRRTIVIANSVARAQEIYEELRGDACRAILGPKTEIRLLHSRFFPSDRKAIESALGAWYGPKADQTDIVLVSTQVIEAGLDYSCDNLHTEIAPMNAVVQRAGRCARRRGETGTVWCYPLAQTVRGTPAYGPYSEMASLVDATTQELRKAVGSVATELSFHDELGFVDRVHTDWELGQLRPLDSLYAISRKVREAMDDDKPEAVRELIRDVSSINVLITDSPELVNFNKKQWPEMLSIPPMSLYRLFKTGDGGRDWIAKCAREQDVFQGGALVLEWELLVRSDQLASAGWLIAIHPSRAKYRDDIGLVIGKGGPAPEIRERDRPKIQRYSYFYETYGEHIRRVCAAGTRRDGENIVASRRLAKWMEMDESCLRGLLELLYQMHDVGKLSIEWQDAIWKWQVTKSGPVAEPRPPLAHSDYDPATDWTAKGYSRPPHAAEGAYAVIKLLEESLANVNPSVFTAALTAIVRHHGAFTSGLSHFRLISRASAFVAETMAKSADDIALCDAPSLRGQKSFSEYLLQATDPGQFKALILYMYFVRRLRIADQNSFSEK